MNATDSLRGKHGELTVPTNSTGGGVIYTVEVLAADTVGIRVLTSQGETRYWPWVAFQPGGGFKEKY